MSSKIADVAGAFVPQWAPMPAAPSNLMHIVAAPANAGAAAEATAAAAQAAADAALADDEGWENGAMTSEDLLWSRLDAALYIPDPLEEQREQRERREELERLIPMKKERIFGSMWHEFNAHSWVYERMTGRMSPNWEYDELANLILELERLV